ncbi:MAG: hypothetical protein HY537_07020 [Deltaproteobacteria bacterium]|nr:hypothetical protein [Deltaproteobacteria bacterium]
MNIELNESRIRFDLDRKDHSRFDAYWIKRKIAPIPSELMGKYPDVRLEIGAGSGSFALALAQLYSHSLIVPIERCKTRARTLLHRTERSELRNLKPLRGNAIPAVVGGFPSETVDRIYVLYPCPWPKNSQRKNRWYLHPIMPHMIRILKKGGKLIWASDQKFYIDEAYYVCTKRYRLRTLSYGELTLNAYNDLEHFPQGRTKFEQTFLSNHQPCYELILEKPI